MTKFPKSLAISLVLIAGYVPLTLSLSALAAAAPSGRSGAIHVTKECSHYTGAAGSFCTITSSNIAEIKVGSKVFYDQPGFTPTGGLDSNVYLYAGIGDWAIGRCVLDGDTGAGLCSFSDGVGPFTGFQARVDVTPFSSSPTEVNFYWDGAYGFAGIGVAIVVSGPGGATSTTNTFQTVSNLFSLDASKSTSSNAGALTYSWSVSPGYPSVSMSGGSTATANIQVGSRGTYQFTLTVTDAVGVTSAATVTVQVV